MNMYGRDYNYANSRLHDTLVRKDGELFYIHSVGRNGDVDGYKVRGAREVVVPLEELDLTPVPLGYVNYEGRASYMVRIPRRDDWRQGLRRRSMKTLDGMNTQHIPNEALCDVVQDSYPSFEYAKGVGDREYETSCAWSRAFSVSDEGLVKYKGFNYVGELVDGEVALFDEFVHLQEVLEESLDEKGN